MRSTKLWSVVVFAVILILGSPVSGTGQSVGQSGPGYPKFEAGLWGGLSGSKTLGTTLYQDSWSSFLLTSVNEMTTIQSKVKSGYSFGGSFAYFITRHFGLRLLAGYIRADVPDTSNFNFAYTWTDGSSSQYAESWAATGNLKRIPLSLDIAAKARIGRFDLEASVGATHFWNTLDEQSTFGYGVMKIDYDYVAPNWMLVQSVDALPVGLTLTKKSWNAWGANIGGSVDFRITPAIGVRGDIRYFYCPKKDLNWDFVVGTYNGLFTSGFTAEPFSDQDVAYLAGVSQSFTLRVNPSFFQLALGVAYSFGVR